MKETNGKTSDMMMVGTNWDSMKFSLPLERVVIKALPSNTGIVWFSLQTTAMENFCYPFMAEDDLDIPVRDLYDLEFYFPVATDKLCIVFVLDANDG